MMSYKPSPRQALAIFSMVFGQRDSDREPDMKTLGLKPPERTQLVKNGLIELEKVSRGQRASLSDRGWAWATDNLGAKLDQRSPAGKTLAGVLALLDSFLGQHDKQLSEFACGSRGTAEKLAKAKQKPTTEPKKKAAKPSAQRKKKTAKRSSVQSESKRKPAARSRRAKTTVASAQNRSVKGGAENSERPASENDNAGESATVAARIRSAAIEIASGATRTRVRLSELRSHLSDLPREQVDRELFRLAEQGGLVLYRIDDTNDLDDDDRRAALMVAGNPRHVLYLENAR